MPPHKASAAGTIYTSVRQNAISHHRAKNVALKYNQIRCFSAMTNKKLLISAAVILVLAASVYLGLRRQPSVVEKNDAGGAAASDATPFQPSDDALAPRAPAKTVVFPGLMDDDSDEEINRLRDFMDANDTAAIIEQASFLASCNDTHRRAEAIEALLWVSTPKAGMALLPLLHDSDEAIADGAFYALQHVLSTVSVQINGDVETGELTIGVTHDDGTIGSAAEGDEDSDEIQDSVDVNAAYDLWLNALKATASDDDAEALLITLAGIDAKFSVPILVDLQESGDSRLAALATEYLDMVTNRSGVTNREQAAEWLMQQEQNTP